VESPIIGDGVCDGTSKAETGSWGLDTAPGNWLRKQVIRCAEQMSWMSGWYLGLKQRVTCH